MDERCAVLLARCRHLLGEIQHLFWDAEHWNRRHPEAAPIEPDPHGELRRAQHALEQQVARLSEAR